MGESGDTTPPFAIFFRRVKGGRSELVVAESDPFIAWNERKARLTNSQQQDIVVYREGTFAWRIDASTLAVGQVLRMYRCLEGVVR